MRKTECNQSELNSTSLSLTLVPGQTFSQDGNVIEAHLSNRLDWDYFFWQKISEWAKYMCHARLGGHTTGGKHGKCVIRLLS